jgi:4-alpha-glucanotransferase
VDYTAFTDLKLRALRIAYAEFSSSASNERRRRFVEFVREAGSRLQTASLFQVLRNHFIKHDAANVDWHRWPKAFRWSASPDVRQFASEHSGEVQFFNWLQWVADQQLTCAKEVAVRAGM